MRIAYCIGAINKAGGTERVLVNKANYFADIIGFEVHIIIADQRDKPLCYPVSKNVHIHDIRISQYLKPSKVPLFDFFLNVRKLKSVYEKVLKTLNPDLIISMERGYEDFIIPHILPYIPKIRESHSSEESVKLRDKGARSFKEKMSNILFTTLYKRQLKKYTHVVLLTERDKRYRSYLRNTTVIPNIVSKFDLSQSELKNTRAISAGRLDQFKNFTDQIKTWAAIVKKYPEWTLHIYGGGPEKEKLSQLISQLNLAQHVFLEGPTDNIALKYQQSSLFIFTSLSEGFGMVLVEAMSLGLPVVSYDCVAGPGEIITDEVDGYLIKPGDLETLLQHTESLITNHDLAVAMGKNAIIKSNQYTPEAIIPKWINLFNTLTHGS